MLNLKFHSRLPDYFRVIMGFLVLSSVVRICCVQCIAQNKPANPNTKSNVLVENNQIDDIEIYFVAAATSPVVAAEDYNKTELIKHINSIKWSPLDKPIPKTLPDWKIKVFHESKMVFEITVYGPDGSLFVAKEKNLFTKSLIWKQFGKELRESKNPFGKYITQ